jgi:DNA-binding MarR family transcriptional regulator
MEHTDTTCASIPLLTQITRLRFLRAHQMLASLDLHPAQFHLLTLLPEDSKLSQSRIAASLMVKPSTLTVMIKRMMRAGLIARERDGQDARVLRVFRTQKGTELLHEACARFGLLEEETFKGLSTAELTLFDSLACRIRDNLAQAIGEEVPPCPLF